MKYFLIFLLHISFSQACFKWCKSESSQKRETQIQQDLQRIDQRNISKDETISFSDTQKEMKTKTIARLVHYSQKNSANWTLKVLDDPCSCISIPEPDELYEDQGIGAKADTNNILYLWNIQIKSVGIAKLQATFSSPHKTAVQEFSITVTD